MLYKKVFYENRDIENERLELTDKGSLYFLGANVTFRNCTLVLKVPGNNLRFDEGTRFIDCTFEVKQELKNHQQWVFSSLQGCRFKGRLTGCDFGHWPDYSERAAHGSIDNCDFTEARLDGCRIMGSGPATVRFPRWPCFTLLDPIRRIQELQRVSWPGTFGAIVVDNLLKRPSCIQALSYHAPSAATRFETTPEKLRAVLETLDGVVF